MDADSMHGQREEDSTQREKRWSMNSQRLEEIVAELMKPISDVRRSFDTDLSALLEEYLTEAGLRALEAGEGTSAGGVEYDVVPNFAELALLLQHSACVYGRKVDFLYQHVLNISDSLQNSSMEASCSTEEIQTPASSRRKRKPSSGEFVLIDLESCPAARRDLDVSRPPPTLPRLYLQLEPRAPTKYDIQLTDYEGEPIGMLADLHVTWRLKNGLLIEELEEPPTDVESVGATTRPLPLSELQAALDAGAPGSPPRCSSPIPTAHSTNCNMDSEQHDEEPRPMEMLDLSQILEATPIKKKRRKHNEAKLNDIKGLVVNLIISEELKKKLQNSKDFSIPKVWIKKVVNTRKRRVLSVRRELRAHEPRPPNLGFRGFDLAPTDVAGFLGWSSMEAAAARAAAKRAEESDDDGFFEQSSLGDSLSDDSPSHATVQQTTSLRAEPTEDWGAWHAEIIKRASLSEGRVVDIQQAAARLLKHVQHEQGQRRQEQDTGQQEHERHDLVSCSRLLSVAEYSSDVPRLFLATLFLANAGNIEVVQGPPLTMNSFSVRLVSTDERLYRAVAAADEQFLR